MAHFKRNNKAKGVAQFPALSIKSKIEPPAIGRMRAVKKAKNTAQIRIGLKGLIKTEIAISRNEDE